MSYYNGFFKNNNVFGFPPIYNFSNVKYNICVCMCDDSSSVEYYSVNKKKSKQIILTIHYTKKMSNTHVAEIWNSENAI